MRLIQTIICGLLLSMLLVSCGGEPKEVENTPPEKVEGIQPLEAGDNSLTLAEREEGWVLLFDGETSEGWRAYKKDYFPSGWKAADGTIQCMASGNAGGATEGGDIIFDKEFENFTLSLDWKISKGGNSGIFYLGQEELDYIWKTAPEMQVLDNENFKEGGKQADVKHMAGALYDLIPANPQNAKPFGQWNTIEITVKNRAVTHKQNGKIVVEYYLGTPTWKGMVGKSKFPELNPEWVNVAKKGYIGLQDHGDDVWYRNIKIKEL